MLDDLIGADRDARAQAKAQAAKQRFDAQQALQQQQSALTNALVSAGIAPDGSVLPTAAARIQNDNERTAIERQNANTNAYKARQQAKQQAQAKKAPPKLSAGQNNDALDQVSTAQTWIKNLSQSPRFKNDPQALDGLLTTGGTLQDGNGNKIKVPQVPA